MHSYIPVYIVLKLVSRASCNRANFMRCLFFLMQSFSITKLFCLTSPNSHCHSVPFSLVGHHVTSAARCSHLRCRPFWSCITYIHHAGYRRRPNSERLRLQRFQKTNSCSPGSGSYLMLWKVWGNEELMSFNKAKSPGIHF